MSGSCSECVHWQKSSQVSDRGDCRRYPPQLFGINASKFFPTEHADQLDYTLATRTHYPVTMCDDFCGEFTRQTSSQPRQKD